MQEPINYERALRELYTRRHRRRVVAFLKKVDLRPASPGQVMLAGVLFVAAGAILPVLHLAVVVGLGLLVFGFVTGLMQPRSKVVKWRNRDIELPPEESAAHRIYNLIYRKR